MASRRNSLESLFGRVISPFERFLAGTTSGGIVLIVATIAALVLATSLGGDTIHHVWERDLSLASGGRFRLELSLHHWVNDGLMTLFFLLVGLELKHEVLVGELSSARDAALPVIAALGGMVVPAVIYAALNAGTPTAAGWGIPMATDIAFAVGIMVLLGDRVPRNLIVFLTALAIADDLGAVLVIAIFYTAELDISALRACGALFVLLVIFNRGGVKHPLPYALVGALLWYYMLASGVHATLAGILLAITIPARAAHTPKEFEERLKQLHDELHADRADLSTPDDPLRNDKMAGIAIATESAAATVQSPLLRMEHALGPWVTFGVIPVFALANAGIDLSAIQWGDVRSSSLAIGIIAGLVIGKFIGIAFFSWIAVKVGVGKLPTGVTWPHVLGASCLAGIGFTMSLFIAQLAFVQPELIEQAKLGILVASVVAGMIGYAWLRWGTPKP
jgi:NhaA family Na+:H+ antiporter